MIAQHYRAYAVGPVNHLSDTNVSSRIKKVSEIRRGETAADGCTQVRRCLVLVRAVLRASCLVLRCLVPSTEVPGT